MRSHRTTYADQSLTPQQAPTRRTVTARTIELARTSSGQHEMAAAARRAATLGIDHLQLRLAIYRTRTVFLPFGPEPLEASTINSEYYILLIQDQW